MDSEVSAKCHLTSVSFIKLNITKKIDFTPADKLLESSLEMMDLPWMNWDYQQCQCVSVHIVAAECESGACKLILDIFQAFYH